MKKLLNNKYVKNFYDILMMPAIRILPGNLAYYLVLSIIPIIALIAALCSKFSLSTDDIKNFFDIILPNNVEDILLSVFNSVSSDSLSVWFVIIGFIMASNGAHSIILSSNILFKIDNKGFLERRIKSLFLTIVLVFLIIFIIVVLGFGNIILSFVLNLKIFKSVSNVIYSSFVILKWPVAIIFIFMLIKVIYTISPDKHIPSKYMNRGARFTTIGLIIASLIYSYYANNIANYSYIYGNLANIIVLIIFVYVISYLLVVGIAMNANIYNIEKDGE
ncbi:MAG: YihY/virulence factor BrkB family protein [Bacilli bacterium]|nr:YihY/virulence factor BrkB family protein [Bacilli bacterium]